MRGTVSKLIFIDSSVNTDGRDHTKVLVPAHPFSASAGERMALSLVSFSMRRNWYNINPTNNTFYLFVQNAYYEVVIEAGVYSTFATADGLAAAINAAMTTTIATVAQIASCATTYDGITRKLAISFTMAAGHTSTEVQIRCFAVKSGTLPNGVSLVGGFNDSYEILGAKPIRSTAAAVGGMVQAASNTLVSEYPASLNSLDAIYLHMNTVETGNFMSTGFESHATDSLRLIESSIFARIPFDDSSFTEAHEVVSFEDSGGDMYQSFLSRNSIDTLDIRVTDARGRSLSQLDPSQAQNGLMGFRMCLRWDLFVPPPAPQPRSQVKMSHPPTV